MSKINESAFEVFETKDEAIAFGEKTLSEATSGYNAVVITEEENAYKATPLLKQPCWGGLRKYTKDNNPDGCTQPEDKKPSDLHYLFPSGTPCALLVKGVVAPRTSAEEKKQYLDVLFRQDSPWRKGFVPGAVEYHTSKDSFTIVFKDTHFDPTVCINILMHLKRTYVGKAFFEFKKLGLSDERALFCSDFFDVRVDSDNRIHLFALSDYQRSKTVDLKKYFSADPNDLSKGTFYDKFDYNRKEVHAVFRTDNGVNLIKELAPVVQKFEPSKAKESFVELIDETLKNHGVAA